MIRYSVITDKGNREYNEDSTYVHVDGEKGCFVLADGLGGQGKGDIASTIVVDTIKECYLDNQSACDESFFENTVEKCREKIDKEKIEQKITEDMMSTMVWLTVDSDYIRYSHVGDSRLYHFESKKIIKRTIDHSVPQALVLAGEIEDAEIRHHQDRNKLLKAIGMELNGKINSYSQIKRDGNGKMFLICSDGFWEHITEKEMEKALWMTGDPQKWLNKMVRIVKHNGSNYNMDNYSAICIYIK